MRMRGSGGGAGAAADPPGRAPADSAADLVAPASPALPSEVGDPTSEAGWWAGLGIVSTGVQGQEAPKGSLHRCVVRLKRQRIGRGLEGQMGGSECGRDLLAGRARVCQARG